MRGSGLIQVRISKQALVRWILSVNSDCLLALCGRLFVAFRRVMVLSATEVLLSRGWRRGRGGALLSSQLREPSTREGISGIEVQNLLIDRGRLAYAP